MKEILQEVRRWLSEGERVALAVVVAAQRPSPRPVGAWMAVTESGGVAGSVSGGCVEGAVIEAAQEVLSGAPPRRLRFGVVDEEGWEVGLACGGEIEVYVEPLHPLYRTLITSLERGETVALAVELGREGHLLAWPDGRREGDASLAPALEGVFPGPWAGIKPTPQGECFVQVFAPPPTLTLVGAVHLAQALARLAKLLGYRVRVVDPRGVFATRERFPMADEVLVAWPQDALPPEVLRPSDAVVALSHDPKIDIPALEIALRSPVGYVGLLGSRRTQGKRRAALREAGIPEEDLARIHGPVGYDLGDGPEEIALGILAEIVATHNRRSGRSKSAIGDIPS